MHLPRHAPSQSHLSDANRASRDALRVTPQAARTREFVSWAGSTSSACNASWELMMPANFDWRSPTEGDYLKHLDRPGFAWEFLRRNPAYQEDYETIVRGAASDAGSGGTKSEALARRWGLSFPGRSKACRGPSGCVLAARDIAHNCSARARSGAFFQRSVA